jgi:hypothetical protein
MDVVLAIVACIILACLTIFQFALLFGAPLGKFAWGGNHTVLPLNLRIGSVVSILLYAAFAFIILDAVRLTELIVNQRIVNVGIWVLTAYFFLGIFMNAISRSKPERLVMTPVAIVLAFSCLLIAIN